MSIDKYLLQWDKALEKGIFGTPSESFLRHSSNDDPEDWDLVYDSDGDIVLNEDVNSDKKNNQIVSPKTVNKKRPKRNKKNLADMSNDMGKSTNPISYRSRKSDQEPHVTPNWSDGEELTKLNNLKVDLYNAEGKLNAASALGKESRVKELQKKVDALKKEIDDVSNELQPSPVNDYLS